MTDAAVDALIDATFGKTHAQATKRVRENERRRRSRLHWLFADADTQASIRDRRVHGCRALIAFRSGLRWRCDACRGHAVAAMSVRPDPARWAGWPKAGRRDLRRIRAGVAAHDTDRVYRIVVRDVATAGAPNWAARSPSLGVRSSVFSRSIPQSRWGVGVPLVGGGEGGRYLWVAVT